MELIITDVNGWSKELEISRAITRLGNASYVDLQIPSKDIAPLQMQILSNPELPTGCRVINMADQLTIDSNGSSNALPPYSTYDVHNGDEIQLGDYRVAFRLPLTTTLVRSSKIIQASLTFSDTMLQPDLDLYGRLVIKNLGEKKNCQFQAVLKGFPWDCFHIDPIPLLYPGAQEEVQVQLMHGGTYPEMGLYDLLLSISAPGSYPGEEVVIRQGIYVAPVFKQEIVILDDIKSDLSTKNMKTSAIEPSDETEPGERVQEIREFAKVAPIMRIEAIESTPLVPPPLLDEATALPEQENDAAPQVEANAVQVEEPQIEIPDAAVEVVTSKVGLPGAEIKDHAVDTQPESSQSGVLNDKEPVEEISSEEIMPENAKSPVKNDLDLSKVKVVRTQAENFWTEK